MLLSKLAPFVSSRTRLRVVPYKATSGRRGRGLKARCGRRETPGKVLKERRSPRQRDRMGTSRLPDRGLYLAALRLVLLRDRHPEDGAAEAEPLPREYQRGGLGGGVYPRRRAAAAVSREKRREVIRAVPDDGGAVRFQNLQRLRDVQDALRTRAYHRHGGSSDLRQI
eukprot:30237-Pelagococcus_subviridis.AAC.8